MPAISSEYASIVELFGLDAERYDRVRPRYPSAMVEAIVAAIPGPDVLDIGVGTGIAARQFQAAGCKVLGIDPDAEIADLARRFGVDVEVAKFEKWESGGRKFDAVISGQAWHWVDAAVVGAAKAAHVLRPGGQLAVFWSVFQPPADIRDAFTEVYRRVLPASQKHKEPFLRMKRVPKPDDFSIVCAEAADGMRQTGMFRDLKEWRFDGARDYTRDEWLDVVPTFGAAAGRISVATRKELLDGIGAVLDAAGGGFTLSYTAVVATATRTDDV